MSPALALPSGPLAAIDLGSNSFRLEIGQIAQGRYRRIRYLKEMVRLGAGLDESGRLGEDASERGLACLGRFAEALAGLPGERVRAVATATLREAHNRDDFTRRAQALLGLPVEVISGREEARLIHAGVSFLQPSSRRRLIVDIGGRSTELVLCTGRQLHRAESFPVGSVSLSLAYFADGQLTARAFRQAQVAAGAALEEALCAFTPDLWDEALGSSGTAGAVSDALAAARITDGTVTLEGLRQLIDRCLEAGHVSRLALPGIKPERHAVLPGGLAILYTLAAQFGIPELRPAKGALRQGVIVDLRDRLRAAASQGSAAQDLRDTTVAALRQRFHACAAQAERVRQHAAALFEQLAPDSPLEARRELGWAAQLHEIGMAVSHGDHHRHGAYLMTHLDADGFSRPQQQRLGWLVHGQRGGLRKLGEALADPVLARQLLSLRLAVIACHARDEVDPDALRLRPRQQQVRLGVPDGWAETHPRTLHLLREEAALWARSASLQLQLED